MSTEPPTTDPASGDATARDAAASGPQPTVWPTVGFTDADAGVRFLTEGLGFVVTALYRADDGTVAHAEARWPDGGALMFGSRTEPGEWGTLGPVGVYVVAAEAATVDAVHARLQGMAGIDVRAVHDTDYGSHEVTARDADGNLWTVGTYRGA